MGRKKAIVGSRDFGELNWLAKTSAEKLVEGFDPDDTLVSGGARGVDSWAEAAARARGLAVEVIEPDWNQHGKAAGPLRNGQIVASAEVVYAIWNGESRGTLDSINKARRAGKLGGTVKIEPNI